MPSLIPSEFIEKGIKPDNWMIGTRNNKREKDTL